MSNSKQEVSRDDCLAVNRALEMKDQFLSNLAIVPYPDNDGSVRFINVKGEYVCERNVIKYWKLTEDESDFRFVVQYGWKRNRLFLIDSNGKEDDPGLGLFIDSPYLWGEEGDCSFIKYYSSGLFLIESHGKYGFATIRGEGLPYQYDGVEEVNDSLLLVKVNNQYGLLDIYGRELTPIKYGWIDVNELRTFSNAVVRDLHLLSRGYSLKADDNGAFRMAVLDMTGREIIPSISYKCITRFRYEQEKEHPFFVVSSSCWKMTVPAPNENYYEDPEIDDYRGERLSSPQWGLVLPGGGEIVPQEYEKFAVLSDKDELHILCHHGRYSILYDLNGDIILGSLADISVVNGYYVLSWDNRSFAVIDKQLMPVILNNNSSSCFEKGAFVCNTEYKVSSWDDPPLCMDEMKITVLPESARLGREDYLTIINR